MTTAQTSVRDSHTVPARKPAARRSTAVWLTLASAVVVLVALLIFVAQNSQSVEIRYLGMNTSLGFWVALLMAAGAGMLLAVLIGAVLKIRHSLRSRSLIRQS